MTATLTPSDEARLTKLTSILAAPLAYEDLAAWRIAAIDAACELLDGQFGCFILPAPGAPLLEGPGIDPAVFDAFARYYHRFDRGHELGKAKGLSVASHQMLYGDELYGTEYYNDFLRPANMHRTLGMSVDAIGVPPFAALIVYRDNQSRPAFDEREVMLGRLAHAVFAGGVGTAVRLLEHRETVGGLLDTFDHAVLACDTDGRPLHANAALRCLLADDAQSERLQDAIGTAVRAAVAMETATSHHPVDVLTSLGRYRITVTRLRRTAPGEPALLARVERCFVLPLGDGALKNRFGLTPREAQVARLIAEGRSNDDVASVLGISPHTGLRHTESIFRKLDIVSRRQVRKRITR